MMPGLSGDFPTAVLHPVTAAAAVACCSTTTSVCKTDSAAEHLPEHVSELSPCGAVDGEVDGGVQHDDGVCHSGKSGKGKATIQTHN